MARGKQIVQCPQCNFTFDISYGRTFACAGCPSLVHCEMVRCPKCGHEFPLYKRPESHRFPLEEL
ncbi:MAG: DNA helicase PriA [Candidatus Freyarchaeota archaeon]